MTAPRCFFVNCKTPVAFTLLRLWRNPKGGPWPLLHCCEAHQPGTPRPPLPRFYRVERIEAQP